MTTEEQEFTEQRLTNVNFMRSQISPCTTRGSPTTTSSGDPIVWEPRFTPAHQSTVICRCKQLSIAHTHTLRPPASFTQTLHTDFPSQFAVTPIVSVDRDRAAMSSRVSFTLLRLETELDRCRAECQWERIPMIVDQMLAAKFHEDGEWVKVEVEVTGEPRGRPAVIYLFSLLSWKKSCSFHPGLCDGSDRTFDWNEVSVTSGSCNVNMCYCLKTHVRTVVKSDAVIPPCV